MPKSKPEADAGAQWLSDASVFKQRQQQFVSTKQWHYSAKVGVTTSSQRESANLIWQYSDQLNTVRLFGPLGAGAVQLQFDEFGAQLSDNKGVLHRAGSAEQLLTKIVGWPIPIDALRHWLFVLPTKDAVYRYQMDEENNVARIEQLGWQIDYSGYKPYGDRFLPRKVVARKELSGGKLVVVKLISKEWR